MTPRQAATMSHSTREPHFLKRLAFSLFAGSQHSFIGLMCVSRHGVTTFFKYEFTVQ